MFQYCYSTGTVLQQYWNSTETVLKHYWNSIATVLKTVLAQYWHSTDTVLKQYWNSTETVLSQYWNSIETVLKQIRGQYMVLYGTKRIQIIVRIIVLMIKIIRHMLDFAHVCGRCRLNGKSQTPQFIWSYLVLKDCK